MKPIIITLLAIVLFSSTSIATITPANYKTISIKTAIVESVGALMDYATLFSTKEKFVNNVTSFTTTVIEYQYITGFDQMAEETHQMADEYGCYRTALMSSIAYFYKSKHAPNPYNDEKLQQAFITLADEAYDNAASGLGKAYVLKETNKMLTDLGY